MAAVIDSDERVTKVHIEGLALLKIAKHCHESLPQMVTGSLLGLNIGNGVLEITHSFPFPSDHKPSDAAKIDADTNDAGGGGDAMEGTDFQMEMMRLLRDVNVDNNCVGWYQSMYLGIFSTSNLLENQFSYQTDLSPNAVVILYDPMQTSHGKLVLKCYRLSNEALEAKVKGENRYLDPKRIFEEVPVELTNPGLVQALLADVQDGIHTDDMQASWGRGAATQATVDTTFDRLDLSTNPYLEKHLEFLCAWVDDLAAESSKFQYYTRQLHREKRKSAKAFLSSEAPRRMESLLTANQIGSYCEQMNDFTSEGLSKLYLATGLHKDGAAPSL